LAAALEGCHFVTYFRVRHSDIVNALADDVKFMAKIVEGAVIVRQPLRGILETGQPL
jgi:hypothetical protein